MTMLLLSTFTLAQGGGGGGVTYVNIINKVSNGNFMSYTEFKDKSSVVLDSTNKDSSVTKVEVNYPEAHTGYVDVIDTGKYTGNAFNQRVINRMILLDSKESFRDATVHFKTPTNGKTLTVWQRLDLGLQKEVWIKLDSSFISNDNKTATGSFKVTGKGLIMIAEE